MVLDINFFRASDDPDAIGPEQIRENQRNRFKDPLIVDQVIAADEAWRKCKFKSDGYKQLGNTASKMVGTKVKAGEAKAGDAAIDAALLPELIELFLVKKTAEIKAKVEGLSIPQLKTLVTDVKKDAVSNTEAMTKHIADRDSLMRKCGNMLHPDAPKFKDEEHNRKIHPDIGTTGDANRKKYTHMDLIEMIDAVNFESGTVVSGNRCYYLKGVGVALEQALVAHAEAFLVSHEYTLLSPPLFMKREIMAEVAQLSQFAEELYKVTGKSSEIEGDTATEEKFLIATAEQPIAAYHRKEHMDPKLLPIKYGGISECFRQEVGSHGRDTKGIFRVHQFKKIEQFVLCDPAKSWEMFDTMIETAEEFCKSIGLAYQVVDIVSGDLNLAAARKYDLEAWFPGQGTYRELVSCSNCLDYQSRRLDIKFGRNNKMDPTNNKTEYVHMLNSTLCATTRMVCCILESFQVGDFETGGGIVIPEVLRQYMPKEFGSFIPFVKPQPVVEESPAEKAAAKAAAKAAKKGKGGKGGK
jgi:seryl-tRNA synthetase